LIESIRSPRAVAISPVGDLIPGDFFAVTGSDFPPDAKLVFEFPKPGSPVDVLPDLVRPHLALIKRWTAALPEQTPLRLHLRGAGWASPAVMIRARSVPPLVTRTLYPGAPRPNPYTIAFVANTALLRATGGGHDPDPIRHDRPAYHDAVGHCLRCLLAGAEDVLRAGDIDRHIRLVSVFDEQSTTPLLSKVPQERMMQVCRAAVVALLARHRERADVVFVIHESPAYERVSAWLALDEDGQDSSPYRMDGSGLMHRRGTRQPGCVALHARTDPCKPTPLHEFGHAASAYRYGAVADLYIEDPNPAGLLINKKFRSATGAPIPSRFATLNGTDYASDPARVRPELVLLPPGPGRQRTAQHHGRLPPGDPAARLSLRPPHCDLARRPAPGETRTLAPGHRRPVTLRAGPDRRLLAITKVGNHPNFNNRR
jgi:hypothetical protein